MQQKNFTILNLDLQSAFLNAMQNEGIEPHSQLPIEADGILRRFRVKGDRSGTKNGWYVLFSGVNIAGSFGYWKSGFNTTWSAKNPCQLTKQEKIELKLQRRKAIQLREQNRIDEQHKVAIKCGEIWEKQSQPVDKNHPYLLMKQIKPYGIRQLKKSLIVPIQDIQNKLVSLQTIYPSGSKSFKPGGKIAGCFMTLGQLTGTVFVCEGYSTGATIHQVTNKSVVIAFNAGNLDKVVSSILAQNIDDLTLIIAADNDHQNSLNIGMLKAAQCATKHKLHYIYPSFYEYQRGSDFNDLHQLIGEKPLQKFFDQVLKEIC